VPGLLALAAPVGQTRAGLPVGAQIIGPRYEDDTPITFAELLADVTGGYQPPPVAVRAGMTGSDPGTPDARGR